MARSTSKRVFGTLVFITAILILVGFWFLLFSDAEGLSDIPGVDNLSLWAKVATFSLVAIIFLMLATIIVSIWSRRQEASDAAEAFFIPPTDQDDLNQKRRARFAGAFEDTTKFLEGANSPHEVFLYDIWRVPRKEGAWGDMEKEGKDEIYPYYFPRSAKDGLYTHNYVDIGGGQTLKLRTLLGGSEKTPGGFLEPEEEPKPVPEVKPRAVLATSEELPGDRFVRDLASRSTTTTTTTTVQEEAPEVYYDFSGDVHQVEELDGIGPVWGEKLRKAGVVSTARLCFEDAAILSIKTGIEQKRIETWQAMAELVKLKGVGPQYAEVMALAGLGGIDDLKKRKATGIADQINEYLDSRDSNVLGQPVTAKRVEGWQKTAKKQRRVRQNVPAE